jgi:predicted deacylase
MDPALHFSNSYAEARNRFLAAVRARGLAVESQRLPAHAGAEGEALAMDVALLGAIDTAGVLVLTSGTHGIEGYCGSGVETALLHDDEFVRTAIESRVAVLFIHAVNPHGFSHGRRVNEDNVDLNRNFRDFALAPPENRAYAELHPLLVPETWPPPEANTAALHAYIAAHGERAFQAALTGGQYKFADGMFYGGNAATWSNRTLRAVLRRHVAAKRHVAWIDIHTGLGARGVGEKIFAGRDNAVDLERARRWWGAGVTSFFEGSSASALITGVVCLAAYDACRDAEITAIGLEYGTVSLEQTFAALRGDHWLHAHPRAPAALQAEIRQRMRDAFYIDAHDWKEQVYAQGRDAALVAIRELAQAD